MIFMNLFEWFLVITLADTTSYVLISTAEHYYPKAKKWFKKLKKRKTKKAKVLKLVKTQETA